PIPRRRRELPLRRRAAVVVLLDQLRDHRASPFDAATADDAGRAVLVRPGGPRRQYVKTTVGHGFSLLLQRRDVPVVERLRNVRQPGEDPGADRPDARRPQLHVGGPHRGAPRRAVWSARKSLRDRAGLRASPRAPARVLGRTRLVGGPEYCGHTDRRGLPCLRTRQLPAEGLPGIGPRAGPRRAPQHRVPVPGEAAVTAAGDGQAGRIPSGRFRELGTINWVMAKLAARRMRVPEMHLFTTLGQRQVLFWTWSMYSGRLLRGRLPAIDTELVILRVAHVRGC